MIIITVAVIFVRILLGIFISILFYIAICNIYHLFKLSDYSIQRQEKIKLSFDDFYKFYRLREDRYDLEKQYYYNFEGKKDFIIK